MVDQAASVIEGSNVDSWWKSRLQVRNLPFDGVDNFESICSRTNHDHSADRFFPVAIKHPASEVRSEVHVRHLAQKDGRAIPCSKYDVVDVGDGSDQADSAHRHLRIVDLHNLCANIGVAALDGFKHRAQRDV